MLPSVPERTDYLDPERDSDFPLAVSDTANAGPIDIDVEVSTIAICVSLSRLTKIGRPVMAINGGGDECLREGLSTTSLTIL